MQKIQTQKICLTMHQRYSSLYSLLYKIINHMKMHSKLGQCSLIIITFILLSYTVNIFFYFQHFRVKQPACHHHVFLYVIWTQKGLYAFLRWFRLICSWTERPVQHSNPIKQKHLDSFHKMLNSRLSAVSADSCE